MAHELLPRSGTLPSAAEIQRLFASEFRYTKVCEADGLREARARAEWIEQAPPNVFAGRHDEALKYAAKLRTLGPGDALTIEFGDDAINAIRIVVVPDQPIFFGYASKDEETSRKELVERCARALDCEVVLV